MEGGGGEWVGGGFGEELRLGWWNLCCRAKSITIWHCLIICRLHVPGAVLRVQVGIYGSLVDGYKYPVPVYSLFSNMDIYGVHRIVFYEFYRSHRIPFCIQFVMLMVYTSHLLFTFVI